MSTRVKIWGTMILVVALTCGMYIYFNQDTKEIQADQPVINDEETIVGTITVVQDQYISITTSDNTIYEFVQEYTIKQGYKTLMVGDQIEISYEKDDAKTRQSAKKVTMIKVHESKIEQMIDQMSLEEKVGQMVMARCPGDYQALLDIESYHLGSYMLFARDIQGEDKASLSEKLALYQDRSKIPMMFSIDEEGGSVNRLSRSTAFRDVPFHSPQALYDEGGMELIISDTKEKAELLQSLGIQVNLAPVADVSTDEDDFINDRTFGQDAQATSEYIKQVVIEAKKNNLGTTLKHFPGYGNNADTHTGIAYDDRSYESFVTSDFLPFQAGIEAGADAVLVSHNIVSSMDETMPASLSKPIHDILRNELKFEGVIMCDDLDMQAIQQFTDFNTSAITAILAGNDLVLCSNYSLQIPAIIIEVENGNISEEQINASVKRILTWKANLQMLDHL